LLALDPANAWAWRELGLILLSNHRWEAAREAAQQAEEREPGNSLHAVMLGLCAVQAGEREEALPHFREAVRRNVDDTIALQQWVGTAPDRPQKVEALQFIQAELTRQTVASETLGSFANLARPLLERMDLLRTLREAHAARPDLWGAWVTLAEELRAGGERDEAQALALEASRRFPLQPGVWLTLGAVYHDLGDSVAELSALGRLRELCPGNGVAMRALAQAHRLAGDLPSERRILELAIRYNPLDAMLRGWLADALERAGQVVEALAALREAVWLEPGYRWAWGTIARLGARGGQPNLAVELAEELTRRRPGEARSWLVLSEVLPNQRSQEQLAALDHMEALNPRSVPLWLRRSDLLLSLGRLSEAAAACAPAVLGSPAPPELQVQAAWVRATCGDRAGACTALERLLADHPELESGWRQLAYLRQEEGNWGAAAGAAEALTRLNPKDTGYLVYAAEARLQAGDRAGAKLHLARGQQLDASNVRAGQRLFELQLEDQEWALARQTLARLQGQLGEAAFLAQCLNLESRVPTAQDFWACFEQYAAAPESDPGAAEVVLESLKRLPASFAAEAWLRARLVRGGMANPELGAIWVRLRQAQGQFDNFPFLGSLPPRTPLARAAIAQQCDLVQEAEQAGHPQGDAFSVFRHDHGDWLAEDTLLWGKVGYVLTTFSDPGAYDWIRGWRQHPEAEDWMLLNALTACQKAREAAEAEALTAEFRQRCPQSSYLRTVLLWHAVRSLAEGDFEPCKDWLSGPPPTPDEPVLRLGWRFLRVAGVPHRRRMAWINLDDHNALSEGSQIFRHTALLDDAWKRILRRISGQTWDPILGLLTVWRRG
jgi:tetratricopeptide (TPR) repeat protein